MQVKLSHLKKRISLETVLLLLGFLVLAAASIYVGIKQGNIEPYINRPEETDIFTYNSIFLADYSLYNIAVSGLHSFLMKWPLFIIQNALGMSQTLYVWSSVLLMLCMNIGIALLIYIFSKKNFIITAALSYCLALATILVDPAYPYMSLSWLTMRNVELPLLILFFLLSMKHKKIFSLASAGVLLFGILLFISDKLLIYYSLAGLAIYLLIIFLKHKSLKALIEEKKLVVLITGSAFFAYFLEFILQRTGLVEFSYSYSPASTIVKSAQAMLGQVLDSISATMTVFGANIFNMNVKYALVFIPVIALMIITVIAAYRLIKSSVLSRAKLDQLSKTVLLLISFLIASILVYILIDRGQNNQARFLVFSLPFGIVISAYYLKKLRIKLSFKVFFAIVFVSSCFLLGSLFVAQKQYYRYTQAHGYDRAVYEKIVNILRRYDVKVLAGNAYVHNIQFTYSSMYGDNNLPIANTIKNCNDFNSGFRANSLYTSTNLPINTAVFDNKYSSCSEAELYKLFGKPVSTHTIKDGGDNLNKLYIFNYDIRSRYKANLR